MNTLGETIALMGQISKSVQSQFLQERARVWKKYGHEPEKYKRFLKHLNGIRNARRLREFHAYTTKPCGCYFDPGGHP